MKDKVKFIKDLAKSINTYSVDSVEYENEDFKIKIKKNREEKTKTVYTMNDSQAMLNMNNNNVHNQAEVVESKPVVEEITGIKIESPMVGTYYSAPSPDSAPFVKEGENVTKGQSLGTVGNSAAFEIADEPHLHFEMTKTTYICW